MVAPQSRSKFMCNWSRINSNHISIYIYHTNPTLRSNTSFPNETPLPKVQGNVDGAKSKTEPERPAELTLPEQMYAAETNELGETSTMINLKRTIADYESFKAFMQHLVKFINKTITRLFVVLFVSLQNVLLCCIVRVVL